MLSADEKWESTDRAEKALAFSGAAAARLRNEICAFDARLTAVSRTLAKHEDLDDVSERHVAMAADRLTNRGRCSLGFFETVGGVLLGIGGSIASQLLRVELTKVELGVAVLFCTAGATLIAMNVRRSGLRD